MLHSRSANAKWLVSTAEINWIHSKDAKKLKVSDGDLLKITTEIGWFVDKVWVTEAIKPGVVANSPHRKMAPTTGCWKSIYDKYCQYK